MRKLNDFYWDKFTYINHNGKVIRDGIKFEDLIEKLLEIEYGFKWERTGKSHDNNRDFHMTTANYKKWAECKNYKNSISLETIAPTLVMAQIFDVNKIIFFSYSEINRSAKKKIYSFAEKAEKEIEIFAGNTLDELILKNIPYLPDKYKPLEIQINHFENPSEVEFDFRFIQTPTIGAVDEDKLALSVDKVHKIFYNKAFEIDFICINNSLSSEYTLEITADALTGTDNDYFTLIDVSSNDLNDLHYLSSVPAASGIVLRFFFKSNKFCPELILPVLHVIIKKNGTEIQAFSSPQQKVHNEWIGKTILVDEKYRTIIRKTESVLLNNDVISCLALYGVSGTGKTRLLQESLEILLKNKYRIISFIGSEKDSTFSVLKEIVYFLYEVPRDEILTEMQNDSTLLEEISGNHAAHQAYQLVKKMREAFTEQNIIDFIDNFFDIIFEKLSLGKIALVIDNVQYFGKPISYFIKKYLMYSKNQICKNTSAVILSFNIDYSTEDSKELLGFIHELETDFYHFKSYEITGFRTENSGILFLRELLQVHDENIDNELMLILQKTSLKPYYIYQGVYYLFEKGAVQYISNQKGYIISMDIFHETIKNMPSNINNIIKVRWESFMEREKDNSENIELIISTIYLFRELSPSVLELLNVSKTLLDILYENKFLAKNIEENYCFDHDILENFFSSYYSELEKPVFKQIQKNRIITKLKVNLFVYNFYKLSRSKITFHILKELYETSYSIEIPLKLQQKYYTTFLAVVLKKKKIFPDVNTWIKYVLDICDMGKNSIGIQQAEKLFDMANLEIKKVNTENIVSDSYFRDYMNKYVDLLFYQKKNRKAIKYLVEIEKIINSISDDSDDFYALKSMLYNRLYINYRELKSTEDHEKAKYCLNESKKWVTCLKSLSLKNEFTYLNLSDEGYDFYCFQTSKEKLLSIWEECKKYPPEILPKKAMNYYRKIIQLALIHQEPLKALDHISAAESFMVAHSNSQSETLVFQFSFLLYKIMALIMNDPYKNKSILMKEINSGYELSRFMAKKNWVDLLNLHGIVCCYQNDKDGVLYHFSEAYRAYNNIGMSHFYDERKQLLVENISTAFSKLEILEQTKEFLSVQDQHIAISRGNLYYPYEASGIQRTSDALFNLPCV